MAGGVEQLEVIACSVADAVAAEHGGATCLEVISHFEQDGLSPPLALVQAILDAVRISIRVMLRLRDSFTLESEREWDQLCDLASAYAQIGVAGVIVGWVRNREVDAVATARILACALPLKATFHRAFETVGDPLSAIATLKSMPQIDRVLLNGGTGTWEDKAERLSDVERHGQPQLHVLVGGGVDRSAIETVCARTPIRAFHLGRAVREPPTVAGVVSAERVREMRRCLAAFCPS